MSLYVITLSFIIHDKKKEKKNTDEKLSSVNLLSYLLKPYFISILTSHILNCYRDKTLPCHLKYLKND